MLFTNTIWPVLREIMSGSRAGRHGTMGHITGGRPRQAAAGRPLLQAPLLAQGPSTSLLMGLQQVGLCMASLTPCFLRVGRAQLVISRWFSVTRPWAELSGEKGHRSSHFNPPQRYSVLNTSLAGVNLNKERKRPPPRAWGESRCFVLFSESSYLLRGKRASNLW